MGQQVIVSVTDDLDGSVADETVKFDLDGVGYEIDLNAKNAAALRKALGNRPGRPEGRSCLGPGTGA